jgi:hypothetical protein
MSLLATKSMSTANIIQGQGRETASSGSTTNLEEAAQAGTSVKPKTGIPRSPSLPCLRPPSVPPSTNIPARLQAACSPARAALCDLRLPPSELQRLTPAKPPARPHLLGLTELGREGACKPATQVEAQNATVDLVEHDDTGDGNGGEDVCWHEVTVQLVPSPEGEG